MSEDKNFNDEEFEKSKEELDIEKLQKKILELKNRKQKKEQRLKKEIRKKRDHRVAALGGMVESMLKLQGSDEVRPVLARLISFEQILNDLGIYTVEDLSEKFKYELEKIEADKKRFENEDDEIADDTKYNLENAKQTFESLENKEDDSYE